MLKQPSATGLKTQERFAAGGDKESSDGAFVPDLPDRIAMRDDSVIEAV